MRGALGWLHPYLHILSARGENVLIGDSPSPCQSAVLNKIRVREWRGRVKSYFIEGNDYETRQTSEGVTKEQTLMLGRAQPCATSMFYAYHYACLTRPKRYQSLIVTSNIFRNVFVLCRVTVNKKGTKV